MSWCLLSLLWLDWGRDVYSIMSPSITPNALGLLMHIWSFLVVDLLEAALSLIADGPLIQISWFSACPLAFALILIITWIKIVQIMISELGARVVLPFGLLMIERGLRLFVIDLDRLGSSSHSLLDHGGGLGLGVPLVIDARELLGLNWGLDCRCCRSLMIVLVCAWCTNKRKYSKGYKVCLHYYYIKL